MQTKLYTKPWMKNFARNGDFRQMVKRGGCVTIRTVMLNEAVDVQGNAPALGSAAHFVPRSLAGCNPHRGSIDCQNHAEPSDELQRTRTLCTPARPQRQGSRSTDACIASGNVECLHPTA